MDIHKVHIHKMNPVPQDGYPQGADPNAFGQGASQYGQ